VARKIPVVGKRPAQHVFPAQHLTLDLHRNESGIGFGVWRHGNVGSVALPASPAQKAGVAQSALLGESQQREPAAPVFFENLSFLFGGAVSLRCADLR
jgi:hypothetical protein